MGKPQAGVWQPTFQYPQSDRRRCNHPRQEAEALPMYPFSILSRIGGVATPVHCHLPPVCLSFQYPQSDRRRCNEYPGRPAPDRIGLSVSSVGSEALQPVLLAIALHANEDFQYPQSDRRRCNLTPADGGRRSRTLSVSSVGSEALQRNCG